MNKPYGVPPGPKSAEPMSAVWSPKRNEIDHSTTRGLIFLVAGKALAISVDFVEKVLEMPPSSPVPCSSEWFLGMVCCEAEPLALIDVEYFLFQERTNPNTNSRAILINSAHGRVVLAVQQIVTLCDLSSRKRLAVSQSELPETFTEYVCQDDDGVVTVLSLAPFLIAAQGSASAFESKGGAAA